MTQHRTILDCDPGRDDALAIALALASPAEVALLGITAVAGNVPLEQTQRNARLVAELCGRGDLPVYAGAARPLIRELETAAHVHGEEGLAGLAVREPARPLERRHAVDLLIETLRAAGPGTITLVASGPLTNLAMAFSEAPDALAGIARIVVMGGAWEAHGNVTPTAEFNIYVDPHAAAVVFGCGRPITVIGLDVTHRVRATAAHAEHLRAAGSPFGPLLRPHGEAAPDLPLHDPCTIAWLVAPDLFETHYVNLAVECEGAYTLGATVVDRRGRSGRAPNVDWATEVDGAAVLDLLVERLSRLATAPAAP
ncbi:MAG: nucleoside hydrolase [Kiloniellaceae bacterium]